MTRVPVPGTDVMLSFSEARLETPEGLAWLRAVAGEVGHRLRWIERREKRRTVQKAAKKELGGATAHHEKVRRKKEREAEAVKIGVWSDVLHRVAGDHRGRLACEACGSMVALEPHHLVLGSREDKAEWVMALCAKCHRLGPISAHVTPLLFAQKIVIPWAKAHGFTLPNRKEYR